MAPMAHVSLLFRLRLDYAGIIALISGSVYAVIYFTFYWQP